ncbi:MAG: hypothetical protein JW827_12065 [Spirochaetes bacterium]|nr:hypothetical protein [Spirochaetota bacterium]
MKYSFCYTIKKIIGDEDIKDLGQDDVRIRNDHDTELIVKCGPWRNSLAEAKKDEKLYTKDKKAFFKMIKEHHGT